LFGFERKTRRRTNGPAYGTSQLLAKAGSALEKQDVVQIQRGRIIKQVTRVAGLRPVPREIQAMWPRFIYFRCRVEALLRRNLESEG
jgi:hypothetical protein